MKGSLARAGRHGIHEPRRPGPSRTGGRPRGTPIRAVVAAVALATSATAAPACSPPLGAPLDRATAAGSSGTSAAASGAGSAEASAGPSIAQASGPASAARATAPASSAPIPFAGRLAVLVGSAGDRRLLVIDAAGGRAQLALPERDIAWISAAPDGRLAATGASGAILVNPRGGTGWRRLAVSTAPVPSPGTGRPLMATWSPDGRLAAILADVATARVLGLLLIDPDDDTTRVMGLDTGLEGSPPAWLDLRLVAIPARQRERPTIALLDVEAPAVRTAVGDWRSIATGADGTVVVLADADDRTATVWPAAAWLAAWRQGAPPLDQDRLAVVRPPPDLVRPTAMALTADGDRLAVTWDGPDGLSTAVTVHDVRAGGTLVARFSIEATSAVPALAWLP